MGKGKTMKVILLSIMLLMAASCMAADVTLAWDLSASDSSITGYRIYASKTSGNYSTVTVTVPRGVTTATVKDLPVGTWYFVATAYAGDSESVYSNEVSKQIQPMPVTIRIVETTLNGAVK